jgi:hypothetical protein
MGDVLHHGTRASAARHGHAAAPESLVAAIAPDHSFVGAGQSRHRPSGLPQRFSITRRWGGGVMPLSSRNDAAHMRKLILRGLAHGSQYQRKLDEQARELLNRVANDDYGAAGALARLENWCERKRRASCWRDILLACIAAERLEHTFPKYIEEAHKNLERCKQLREHLVDFRKFLRENQNKSWAVLWGNRATIELGLDLLEYGIDTQKCVAEEAFAQVGASRKWNIESASRNAAIWTLSEAVKLYTGKPHQPEVANLASAILRTEISENIVKHAVRKRGPRFNAMAKRRAERLLDSRMVGSDFERIRRKLTD